MRRAPRAPVAWTRLRAPRGSMSPTPLPEIDATVAGSPLLARYVTAIDRDSAREMLTAKLDAAATAAQAQENALAQAKANADAEKAANKMATDQARMQRQAQAEYDRQLRQTRAPARRTTSRRSRTCSATSSVRRRRRPSSRVWSRGSSEPAGARRTCTGPRRGWRPRCAMRPASGRRFRPGGSPRS